MCSLCVLQVLPRLRVLDSCTPTLGGHLVPYVAWLCMHLCCIAACGKPVCVTRHTHVRSVLYWSCDSQLFYIGHVTPPNRALLVM